MNKEKYVKHFVIVFLPVWFFCCSIAAAEDSAPPRSISVSGTVETKVEVDQIVWRIRLTDSHSDMLKAKEANDRKIDQVMTLRKKLKLADGDFEAGKIRIRRENGIDERGRRNGTMTYLVTRSVLIRQRDLSQFDTYLDALVGSAEMEIDFSYESSRIHEIRFDTRLKALKAAKEKAAAMAEAVDAKLGKALTIEEREVDRPWIDPYSNAAVNTLPVGGSAESLRFVPGSLEIKMTVHATFELT
jgi:uncharacterized protein